MKSVPTNSPTSVAALDEPDPKAGGARHLYAIQFGGPKDLCKIQFQHGPRGVDGSVPGIYTDDLLAIIQQQLEDFQAGPFACPENGEALGHIQAARHALSLRTARRLGQGVLGLNEQHKS